MAQFSLRQTRRKPKGSHTDGYAGRTSLAGSPSRNLIGSRSHPPARFQQARRKFGDRIHTLRRNLGLSQEHLGNDCGTTAAKIRKIESGEVELDLFLITRLSDRFGVKLDRLFRGIK